MNSLKDLTVNGLKELRDNGLKGLKVNGLKDLMLKPKTADVDIEKIEDIEDLTKNREQVKRKIIKLVKEKKEIEARIDLIQKAGEEKNEEISEFPWREEIFPPLSRKIHAKISGSLEAKKDSLHSKENGSSEIKVSEVKLEVREIDEKSRNETPERKIPEDTRPVAGQTTLMNDPEGADLKNGTGKKEDKAFQEKTEKITTVYPFSAGKVNENKVSSGNSSEDSIEKSKPESKNNPSASLFGNSLIEELLNSEDLNPEEEQSFMKYLEEQDIGELIVDLKNVRALLARAGHTG